MCQQRLIWLIRGVTVLNAPISLRARYHYQVRGRWRDSPYSGRSTIGTFLWARMTHFIRQVAIVSAFGGPVNLPLLSRPASEEWAEVRRH